MVPTNLREKVLHLAHEGHPVKTCRPCQMVGMPNPPEPLKRTTFPSRPWQHISVDLMTPSLPSGDHLFVGVDYYSHYMEVDVLKTTTADKVIGSLKRMFLAHGLPVSIKSDNAPQFISQDFKKFVKEECINHSTVTPLWPQANGENRSLLKRIKIAQIEEKNWKEEIGKFMTWYRTTPHSTTGMSPAELLFRRKLRTRIPTIDEFSAQDQEVQDRDGEAKEKGKLYADEKRQACESDMKEGYTVLLKQQQQNKLTPTFSPEPFRVLEKTGNSVVVESPEGIQYKRNSTHVNRFLERHSPPENQPTVPLPDPDKSPDSETPLHADEADRPLEATIGQPTSGSTTQPALSETTLHRPPRIRTLPARFRDFDMPSLCKEQC